MENRAAFSTRFTASQGSGKGCAVFHATGLHLLDEVEELRRENQRLARCAGELRDVEADS
ncbi:hypothetical protein [Pseudomonas oryzihabitans]|uniref:hypothetical protein n=1 Tax=Pseudomonas oryzihabitans TaxID=47885 RepID=UPI0011AA0AE4|nr:hypothetical protein [Pseudomonas psychrotolerans]